MAAATISAFSRLITLRSNATGGTEVLTPKKCVVSQDHKGRLMIHQESWQYLPVDPKELTWDSSNARCGLLRPGSHETVVVIGRRKVERIPTAVPHNFFFVLLRDVQPGIDDDNHLCLLLEHHRRIHWKTLNVESGIVSGRIYTDVV
jgi:hypothetical protein